MDNCCKYRVVVVLIISSMFSGCMQMSEKVTDKSAGLNGGFEISENGLPVNWLMYTPNTVKKSDFKIILDDKEFVEGKQSLQFKVNQCTSTGGWFSPGFTNEFFDAGKFEGEATYIVSFWVKNNGTTFKVSGGGVASKTGEMRTLIQSHEQIDDWKKFQFEVAVPQDKWLRVELNILEPGTFWIDDLRIEAM